MAPADDTTDLALRIEGMTCGSCVARVEAALTSTPGVSEARVNLATEIASARVGNGLTADALIEAVRRAGYDATPLSTGGPTDAGLDRRHAQRLREHRQAVVTAIGMGLPIMGLHWFAPMLSGTQPGAHFWPGLLQGLLMVMMLISPAGGPILIGGLRALIHRAPNMDLLIALGVSAATIGSVIGLFVPALMHVNHFHEAAMILAFINVGKYLEARARGRASESLSSLIRRTPRTATRIENGEAVGVTVDQIRIGDVVQVAAESYVPVDGKVRSGQGSVDQSMWTGEPVPVDVGPGDAVLGGSYVHSGAMTVEATAVGAASAIHRIARLVEEAQTSKTRLQRIADRVAGMFVPIVVVLAAITFAGWLLTGGLASTALAATVAVLVIACPCAMGLATPTAVMVATGNAALRGIIVRDAAALERAGKAGVILLDKTGTLTLGKPDVAEVRAAPGRDPAAVLTLAAAAEQFSPHPLARAITKAAREQGLSPAQPDSYQADAGFGVCVTLGGCTIRVGSERYLRDNNIDLADTSAWPGMSVAEGDGPAGVGPTSSRTVQPPGDSGSEATTAAPGTLVHVAEGSEHVGTLVLRDRLRDTARETVAALKRRGLTPVLVTGDRRETAMAVAGELGIDQIEADVSPGGKQDIVEAYRSGDPSRLQGSGAGGITPGSAEKREVPRTVIMVGDGINDAPALAAADVGIALAGGTDVAAETAGIILVNDRLDALPEVIDLARRSTRIIHQNLFWAFGYNVAAIPLAAFGILPAAYAAAAMMCSSISVVLNSLRLQKRA